MFFSKGSRKISSLSAALTKGTNASGPPPPATAIARCNVALCLANWREVISKQRNSSGTWAFRWRTPTSVVKSQHPGKGILIKSVGISLLQGVLVSSRIPSYTKQASSTSPSHILLFAFLFQYCLITERDISGLVFRFKPIRPSWHVFCYPCVPLLKSMKGGQLYRSVPFAISGETFIHLPWKYSKKVSHTHILPFVGLFTDTKGFNPSPINSTFICGYKLSFPKAWVSAPNDSPICRSRQGLVW